MSAQGRMLPVPRKETFIKVCQMFFDTDTPRDDFERVIVDMYAHEVSVRLGPLLK